MMRLALALHFADPATIEDGSGVIPAVTIERAVRLMDFVIRNAAAFYQQLDGKASDETQAIAAWILAQPKDELTIRDFGRGPRCCRGLKENQVRDMLSVLVLGGWLIPDTNFPSNRLWTVPAGLRERFAAQRQAHIEKCRRVRELIMNNAEGGLDAE
jgi:hypothetical protein